MIVNNSDAVARLNSPINLMNKLKSLSNSSSRTSAMSLFGIGKTPAAPKIEEKLVEEVKVEFNPFCSANLKEESQSSLLPQLTSSLPSIIPSSPVLDDILGDHDTQISLGLAHDGALKLLNASVTLLAAKLDDVKADKLPAVISAASKTVESIRRERNENAKQGKDREVHYHFYTPEQKKVSDYEVIDVTA